MSTKPSQPDSLSVLSLLIKQTDRDAFIEALKAAIETDLSDHDRRKLLSALDANGLDVSHATHLASVTAPLKRHCVRCHQPYTEHDNYGAACVMEHEYPYDTGTKFRVGSDLYMYICRACGQQGLMEEGDCWNFKEPCFRGLHTEYSEEVKYDNENTFTCKRNKCHANAR